MARSVALKKVTTVGDAKKVTADVTLDNSYPAGGYPLTGADLGLGLELRDVDCDLGVKGDRSLGVIASYDETNKKLQCFKSNTAANPQEVANGADLSTYVVRVKAFGKGDAAVYVA